MEPLNNVCSCHRVPRISKSLRRMLLERVAGASTVNDLDPLEILAIVLGKKIRVSNNVLINYFNCYWLLLRSNEQPSQKEDKQLSRNIFCGSEEEHCQLSFLTNISLETRIR